jgi:hypothetical protein
MNGNNMSKFEMKISVMDDGVIDISSEGECHHIFLVGILEAIKTDVLMMAASQDPASSKQMTTMPGLAPQDVTSTEKEE